MRRPRALPTDRGQPNLARTEEERHLVLWTRGLGEPPEVYGERVVYKDEEPWRRWEIPRSKLAAALEKGYSGPLPRPDERWLYLGAASGTTASHVADLVGRHGSVFAVEKSVRPFARLLSLAERYPNLLPILADARSPTSYLARVPPVDGLYVDVAQPDQVALTIENARWFLRPSGVVLLALKTSSMGREVSPREHLDRALRAFAEVGEPEEAVALDPFHKRHFLFAVHPTRRWFAGGSTTVTRPAARRAARGP